MRFYQHLYMGEQAAGKRFQILQSLRKRKIQPDLYVITPASGGNNLLDIYSCREIRKPWHEAEDPLIVGIAAGDMRRPAVWQGRLSARCTGRPGDLR